MAEQTEKEILMEINESLKEINQKLVAVDNNHLEEIDDKLTRILRYIANPDYVDPMDVMR